MRSPRREISPASARYKPESRLIVVVFPEPFGPMRPLTSPGRTAKGRLSTATSPPNRFVKPRVSSNHPFSDTLPLSSGEGTQDWRENFWNVWQSARARPRLTAKVQVTSLT